MPLANSDPLFHVTGPVHHYVQLWTPFNNGTTASNAGGIWYLGTAEVRPQVTVKRVRKKIMNDLFGTMLPANMVYQGQFAQIGVALNYFSQSAVNNLRATGVNGVNRGADGSGAVGSLEYGVHSFKLWQVYGNYNFSGGSVIPPGRYWPNVLIADETEQQTGLVDQIKMFVFEAYKLPACTTGVRSGVLYSEDPTDFPSDVRVPPC